MITLEFRMPRFRGPLILIPIGVYVLIDPAGWHLSVECVFGFRLSWIKRQP